MKSRLGEIKKKLGSAFPVGIIAHSGLFTRKIRAISGLSVRLSSVSRHAEMFS